MKGRSRYALSENGMVYYVLYYELLFWRLVFEIEEFC